MRVNTFFFVKDGEEKRIDSVSSVVCMQNCARTFLEKDPVIFLVYIYIYVCVSLCMYVYVYIRTLSSALVRFFTR